MKILVINNGSSSIKCCIYSFTSEPEHPSKPLWEAHLQWKNGFENTFLTIGEEQKKVSLKSQRSALEYLISLLHLSEIDVVGHRIVHGGRDFKESVIINNSVKEKIGRLSEFAPLHNTADLEGIELLEKSGLKQIAVFDTAFHHTISPTNAIYPGPYKWMEDGIQRYGFHGISFQYCTRRASEILKANKMVICHLGSGASLCAVKNGISIDTTMGFTPLDGLMMDTRCGSIDPGIVLHLLKNYSVEALTKMLYKESGLLGVSGISSDMRDIIENASAGNKKAKLSLEVYIHRLNALIGSMIASLEGIDTLIFTAGIGENAPLIRKKVCDTFSFLGVKLDENKNLNPPSEDCLISHPSSSIKVLVIHTQESFEIARECWRLA